MTQDPEDAVLEQYFRMAVAAVHEASPDDLVDELGAIRSFFITWKDDFKKENDPRMALMCAFMSRLIDLLSAYVYSQCTAKTEPDEREAKPGRRRLEN